MLIPIRIPALTTPEVETFLNLLFCKLYLPEQLEILTKKAAENRRKSVLDVAINHGIVADVFDEQGVKSPPELEKGMHIASIIAPLLAQGLQGNPRQIKRFLNTLVLRIKIAEGRGARLQIGVLAKLMVLEYLYEDRFRELFQWQLDHHGLPPQIKELEETVAAGKEAAELKYEEISTWLENARLKQWVTLDPSLSGVDLGPYFYFARERLFSQTTPPRRLSQAQQELLVRLQSESEAERNTAIDETDKLSIEELQPLYEVLLERFKRDVAISID